MNSKEASVARVEGVKRRRLWADEEGREVAGVGAGDMLCLLCKHCINTVFLL